MHINTCSLLQIWNEWCAAICWSIVWLGVTRNPDPDPGGRVFFRHAACACGQFSHCVCVCVHACAHVLVCLCVRVCGCMPGCASLFSPQLVREVTYILDWSSQRSSNSLVPLAACPAPRQVEPQAAAEVAVRLAEVEAGGEESHLVLAKLPLHSRPQQQPHNLHPLRPLAPQRRPKLPHRRRPKLPHRRRFNLPALLPKPMSPSSSSSGSSSLLLEHHPVRMTPKRMGWLNRCLI